LTLTNDPAPSAGWVTLLCGELPGGCFHISVSCAQKLRVTKAPISIWPGALKKTRELTHFSQVKTKRISIHLAFEIPKKVINGTRNKPLSMFCGQKGSEYVVLRIINKF